MPAGRPSEYNYEELKPLIEEYFVECVDVQEDKEHGIAKKVNLPSIEGLCLKLHISKDTLYRWEKEYVEFSYYIDTLRQKQANCLLNNGLSGNYNPTIAKVILTKHGYREGQDITTNDKDIPQPILNVQTDTGNN